MKMKRQRRFDRRALKKQKKLNELLDKIKERFERTNNFINSREPFFLDKLTMPYKTWYIFKKKKKPTQVQQVISSEEFMIERDPTGQVRQTRQQDILEKAQTLKSTAPDPDDWWGRALSRAQSHKERCDKLQEYRAQFYGNYYFDGRYHIKTNTPLEEIQSYLEHEPEFDILEADKYAAMLLPIKSTDTYQKYCSVIRNVDVSQFLTTDLTLYKFLTSDYKLLSKK